VAEPDNPHDRNAVAVLIAGQTVGYLPREDAPAYSRVLQRLASQGFVAQVSARIWASDFDDYEVDRRGNYVQSKRFGAGIKVDLGEPHLLVPGNMHPPGAHELLPLGGAIQVTGEEAHADVLAAYSGSAGEQWAYATLHEMTQQLARSTRTVVEVRLDDQRIGQLTPKMSGDLLVAIRHINESGGAAACRALVKGNRAAAQVTLYVQRSHELEDAWFDTVRRRQRGSSE
jgi:collagen type III alpha